MPCFYVTIVPSALGSCSCHRQEWWEITPEERKSQAAVARLLWRAEAVLETRRRWQLKTREPRSAHMHAPDHAANAQAMQAGTQSDTCSRAGWRSNEPGRRPRPPRRGRPPATCADARRAAGASTAVWQTGRRSAKGRAFPPAVDCRRQACRQACAPRVHRRGGVPRGNAEDEVLESRAKFIFCS